MIKPETKIVTEIMDWVIAVGGEVHKLHGDQFSRRGEPDLDGALFVIDNRTVWPIHFKVEVKQVSTKPDKLQVYRLTRWSEFGYATGVATSVETFQNIIASHFRYVHDIGLRWRFTDEEGWYINGAL